MKLSYYPETDSLYVELSDKPGADTVTVGEVVVDVDEDGNPVGLDIGANASKIVDLASMGLEGLSLKTLTAGLSAAGSRREAV